MANYALNNKNNISRKYMFPIRVYISEFQNYAYVLIATFCL
jgi:hypothetical protein